MNDDESYVTNRPFQAYDGDRPYIFISYKHADWKIVYPVIQKLHEAGFNIWYDADLTKGKYYDIQIANHIKNSDLFVTFITREAIRCSNDEDDYLIKELAVANNFNVEKLPIFLEDVQLDGFYLMHYVGKQSILRHEYAGNDDKFISECIRTIRDDFNIPTEGGADIRRAPSRHEILLPNANLVNTEGRIHEFFDALELYDDRLNGHFYKDYLVASIDNFMANPNSYNAFEFYRKFFTIYKISFEDKSAGMNFGFDSANRVLDAVKLVKRTFPGHDILPHSMNVFLLGLAIYCDSSDYRNDFKNHVLKSDYRKYYRSPDGGLSDEEFLYRWGVTSLLHALTHAFPTLDENGQKSFLSDLCNIMNIDIPVSEFWDLNSVPAINPNDSSFTDSVRPLSILSKRISEDFGWDLNRVYLSLNEISSYMRENGIFERGAFSAMLVLHLYGRSIQECSKDPSFFIYPIVDSASAIFLRNVYRNLMLWDFDLGKMECFASPLACLLILCSSILTFDSADIEYRGKLDFIFNVAADSKTPDLWKDIDFYLYRVMRPHDISSSGLKIRANQVSMTREYMEVDYPPEELDQSEVSISLCEGLAIQSTRDMDLSVPFGDVPSDLKLSQIIECEKLISRLHFRRYEILPKDDENVPIKKFTEPVIEELARWKHEKYCEYRHANGWTYGPVRDNEKLTTPYLVPWEELPRNVQDSEIDFMASGKIFAYLDSMGYMVIDLRNRIAREMTPDFRDYSDLFY